MFISAFAKCSFLSGMSVAVFGLSGEKYLIVQILASLGIVGRNPKNGKKKGRIEVHIVINVDETVPKLLWFTEVSTHDHVL